MFLVISTEGKILVMNNIQNIFLCFPRPMRYASIASFQPVSQNEGVNL